MSTIEYFYTIVLHVLSSTSALFSTAVRRSQVMTAPYNIRWFARLDRRRVISNRYPDFEVISNAAERLLENDSAIWTIWLFGSRARGTAQEESDWDLALITSTYSGGERMYMSCAPTLKCARGHAEINCIRIPIDVFLNHRLTFPHIAWAIAREGIPIAQRQWRLPIHQSNEEFSMDFQEYRKHLAQTHGRINVISNIYETLTDLRRLDLWDVTCDRLQDETQTMAEGFIKAGCIQRGFEDFPKVHDFNELAQSVRDRLGEEEFARTIASLNGQSAEDNKVQYFPNQDPTRISGAISRFGNLCAALPRELFEHASVFRGSNDSRAVEDLTELAQLTANELSRAKTVLTALDVPKVAPTHLDENTAARVLRAWKGIEDIRQAIDRAERDFKELFQLR